jgi:hypothetical protein
MDSLEDAIAIRPTFKEMYGVYKVPPIDWKLYTEHARNVVEKVVKELITYNGFYWTIRIGTTPSVSKQKLRLDIICITKQKVRLVKFLSNFVKRTRMLPETM